MNQLYRKNEVCFAILWIVIYVAGTSLAESLSGIIGLFKVFPALYHVAMACFLLLWLRRNGLYEKYGLFLPRYRPVQVWFFLPLALIAAFPLFFSPGLHHSPGESALFVVSMLCVGILEELIFRGFLFRAIEKKNPTCAIVISSVAFGIGHIVNLLSGQDPAATLAQIAFAVAVGFALVILFYRGGSLLPCIVFHSVNNALSVFGNEEAQAQALGGKTEVLLIQVLAGSILLAAWSVWNWKHLKISFPRAEDP